MTETTSTTSGGSERPRLVLASASPRRRMLFERLRLDFTVRPAHIDESIGEVEAPEDAVERLARQKAEAEVASGELVLGADTIVLFEGEILGQPRGPDEAVAMLGRLAGRHHTVLTGVALRDGTSERTAATVAGTDVEIAAMRENEIDWYVATGEPLDKAGSYAVQGIGALFVEAVIGDYTNVVGLPLPSTRRLFEEVGRDLREWMT